MILAIRNLLRWLNTKLRVVETNDDHNAYYAWADARLDELAATADQARKRKMDEALERQRGYRLMEPNWREGRRDRDQLTGEFIPGTERQDPISGRWH